MAEDKKMQEMQSIPAELSEQGMQQMKNAHPELSDEDLQEVAAGGKHCSDGRLIVWDFYICKYFERIKDSYVVYRWCGHCKYRTTSHGWIVCDHPGNRH